MYSIGSSARRGFGVIPPLVVSGGISLLSGLFGSHSGKTTHAQRFVAAQQAGDTALTHLLIDQAYSHAYLEAIKDKADWQQVWQVMLNEADPDATAYMNRKMGVGGGVGGAGGVTGSPNQAAEAGAPGTPGGFLSMLFSPVGIAAVLAVVFAVGGRKGRR